MKDENDTRITNIEVALTLYRYIFHYAMAAIFVFIFKISMENFAYCSIDTGLHCLHCYEMF